MATHVLPNEFEISIARYRRLAHEVTDPLAMSLLALVIGDLEQDQAKPGTQPALAIVSLSASAEESAEPPAVWG